VSLADESKLWAQLAGHDRRCDTCALRRGAACRVAIRIKPATGWPPSWPHGAVVARRVLDGFRHSSPSSPSSPPWPLGPCPWHRPGSPETPEENLGPYPDDYPATGRLTGRGARRLGARWAPP
jgi:hypothetical protein